MYLKQFDNAFYLILNKPLKGVGFTDYYGQQSMTMATGQFGKNHQGDRNEHLPTIHGFGEFFGNIYHLNAEEEPENKDYPRDMVLKHGKTFLQTFGPRGVLHT